MKSLLFLPDISGFTEFIQNTEVEHSQHVIAELLDILIQSNIEGLELAEVEGDALFFFKENEVPSLERLLAQAEQMYTAFYSHLELLKKNRVCPCNACMSAPNLQLKIVAHCCDIQFINVQNKRKPFGKAVIQVHRLLKNSVDSDNYILISDDLRKEIHLSENYQSKLFNFNSSSDFYDGEEIPYVYSEINTKNLQLKPYSYAHKVNLGKPPTFTVDQDIQVSKEQLLELITNYKFRHEWTEGVEKFEYNEDEVTRLGTEHVCVVNGKHFNLVTVTKDVPAGVLVYGEYTASPPIVKSIHTFYQLSSIGTHNTKLEIQLHLEPKNWINKLFIEFFVKKLFLKNSKKTIEALKVYAEEYYAKEVV
ncbi:MULTISPECIES: DUF2652 domain-containing protein [Flammeovirga]|nr:MULTISPECIES: DUF2652 domain-containing protein [Flammeovirga]